MAWDDLISKIIWLLLQPSNLFLILFLIGLILVWRNHRRSGLSFLTVCAIFYSMVMFGPLTSWLMAPLEKRFSSYTNHISDAPYSGIIILAGAERLKLSTTHNQVTLSGAAERLIEAAKLARQFPDLSIVYSGGGQIKNMLSESEIARKYFIEAGIDLSRIRFEDQSYNTYTNALETKKHIQHHETDKWLLVTSAFHMPRAVGAYRSAQINIQPYPVDYRTYLKASLINKPDAGQSLYQLDFAVHEWVGLLAYYMSGRNEEFFPAPKD
ncbi:Putative membrane protein [hydrothermal vent metagenome]|uniref:Membrane protein n=1 Tax=hydrothermal vent metagenome TaxID=652676 RepID=A0A3B1B7R1_9ZZZZ